MAVRDFPPRPQGATPDSVPYQNWLDALGNRQNIDLLQELTSVDNADEVAIFDASETGQNKTKKITVANLLAGAGGGVSWQSVQTSDFNASSGNAYPIDTSSGAITVTLPASPVAGDLLVFVDYAGTWDADNVTVDPNGNNFLGSASNKTLDQQREGITLVYIDSTQGWLPYSGFNEVTPTSPPFNVDFVVVAGGGGGGRVAAGGGGGGGYRASVGPSGGGASSESALSLLVNTNYTVTVGAGGAASTVSTDKGTNGSASVFSTVSTVGGGGGGSNNNATGANGGSGGGARAGGSAGSGTANQGYAGGTATSDAGGGGGGAGAVGGNSTDPSGPTGAGGAGVSSSITGSSITRGGGGGGQTTSGADGAGGSGGGGNGGSGTNTGQNGTANTGGGGGGSRSFASGNGGSGVVIIKYPDTVTISNPGGGLTYSTAGPSGGFYVTTFTAGTGNVSWS